jgi:hypothetical protein
MIGMSLEEAMVNRVECSHRAWGETRILYIVQDFGVLRVLVGIGVY